MGDDFVGKELGGSYRIIRRMAEGGMGAIYEAEHLRVSKKVVVKVLQRDVLVNKEAYHRFVREAEVTSAIGHPNIVEVLDFNYTEDGIPFLVLEYLDGEDLATILERRGQLGPEQVVLFAREVGSALKAAHDKGIVHRDLKPHNIFLCRFGERDDFPKILDFGISKIKGSDSFLTQSQSYLGSAHYMAPEQARGRSAESDERTDVFALGAILYRMLTGQEAFEGDSLPSILYNIVHTHPDPVSAVNPAVPGPVSDAIERAMAKAPGDRFQSIAQMVDTLVAAAGPLADRAALPSHLAPAPLASPPGPGEAAALPEEATAPTVLEKPPGPAAPPRSVPSVSLSGEIGSATEGELEHLRRISKH
jgi:serine/threonine protein kinase